MHGGFVRGFMADEHSQIPSIEDNQGEKFFVLAFYLGRIYFRSMQQIDCRKYNVCIHLLCFEPGDGNFGHGFIFYQSAQRQNCDAQG